MRVGDNVLLKPNSQWRPVLGKAAGEVGIVTSVVGQMITVDYPDVPFYTRLIPGADFSKVEDPASSAQVGQWQELVALLDARTAPRIEEEHEAAVPVETAS